MKSGLTVNSFAENGKAKDISFRSDDKKTKLTGLPYGLSLYISTLGQCMMKFKACKPACKNPTIFNL